MNSYQIPSTEEMRRIERRAQQMRAAAMASGMRSVVRAIAHTPVALGAMLRRAAHI